MDTSNLPTLPEGKAWDVRDFQGNEIQWYGRGQRLEVRVVTPRRILGIRFNTKDYDYPTLLMDPLGGEAELLATAQEIITKHDERLARLANGEQLRTTG